MCDADEKENTRLKKLIEVSNSSCTMHVSASAFLQYVENKAKLPGLVLNSVFPGIGRSYSPLGVRMPRDMWSFPVSSLIKASIR